MTSRKSAPAKGSKRKKRRPRFRQYHFIIPTHYNDGRPVEPERTKVTDVEIVGICKGWSGGSGEGRWMATPVEGNYNFWVNVPDTAAYRTFFRIYRLILRIRFEQDEIYMESRPVSYVPEFELSK